MDVCNDCYITTCSKELAPVPLMSIMYEGTMETWVVLRLEVQCTAWTWWLVWIGQPCELNGSY